MLKFRKAALLCETSFFTEATAKKTTGIKSNRHKKTTEEHVAPLLF
jgi:hypothetical protein